METTFSELDPTKMELGEYLVDDSNMQSIFSLDSAVMGLVEYFKSLEIPQE
jgi:hypothetical protein